MCRRVVSGSPPSTPSQEVAKTTLGLLARLSSVVSSFRHMQAGP